MENGIAATSESDIGLPSFKVNGISLEMKLMPESDLPVLEQMIETIGWPIYLMDISCHYRIYRHGFFGLYSPDGEIMSSMTACPVGDEMVFISLFIVNEKIRGKGLGTRFLRYIMDKNSEKNIVLESVVESTPLYERMGFKASDYILEYIEIPKAYPIKNYDIPAEILVRRIKTKDDVKAIGDFDKSISHVDRVEYMTHWLLASHCQTFTAIQDGACVGFACFRHVRDTVKVQPLYAENESVAIALIQSYLLGARKDAPHLHFTLLNWRKYPHIPNTFPKFGDVEPSEVIANLMFTKESIQYPLHKVYGISNTDSTPI